VYAGETVRCVGHIAAVDGSVLTVEQRVEVVDDGRVAVAPASAEVLLR